MHTRTSAVSISVSTLLSNKEKQRIMKNKNPSLFISDHSRFRVPILSRRSWLFTDDDFPSANERDAETLVAAAATVRSRYWGSSAVGENGWHADRAIYGAIDVLWAVNGWGDDRFAAQCGFTHFTPNARMPAHALSGQRSRNFMLRRSLTRKSLTHRWCWKVRKPAPECMPKSHCGQGVAGLSVAWTPYDGLQIP